MNARTTAPNFISASGVRKIGGFSETTLKRILAKDPTFPRPMRLTPGQSGHRRWIESEIIEWMESRREGAASE